MTSTDDARKLNTREIYIAEHQYAAEAKRSLAFGQVDSTTFLPIKVVSDSGTPELGKLSCTVE